MNWANNFPAVVGFLDFDKTDSFFRARQGSISLAQSLVACRGEDEIGLVRNFFTYAGVSGEVLVEFH